MGFLKRLLGGGDEAALPIDLLPLEGAAARRFLALVEADLRRRGLPYAIADGAIHIQHDGDDEPARYGLSNLAQTANLDDESAWSRIIATHFDSVFAMRGRDLDALAADYEQVRAILRVRLQPDESMGGVVIPDAVTWPVAPGILGTLVYDFPDSTATVPREHLADWPVDQAAAIEQALDNLAAEPVPLHDEVANDEAHFTLWYGDSFYVSTLLLRPGDKIPPDVTDAVVAVPNRHTFLVHHIRDASVLRSMEAIHRATLDLFRDGPGSISDQPYWWHEGRIVPIPHRVRAGGVDVLPPDEFVALLETVVRR